jgi:translocation and assembly module TamB
MASGMRFGVQRIEGSLYGRMRVIGLEVRDTRGVFLSSPALTLDWRPLRYLRGKVDVRELSAAEVRLIRLPDLRPVPSDPNAPLLPDLDIAVGKLRVDRFIVEPAVTGRRHIVRLAGAADIADGRARITADAAALRGAGVAGGDTLRLTLDAVPDANRLRIEAAVNAPAGGLVDSFSGLGRPLAFTLAGRGDWANWRGRLSGNSAGTALADLAVTARDGLFTVKGDAMPGAVLAEGPATRLAEPAIAIDLAARLGERRAQIRFTASSNAMTASAEGMLDLGRSRFGNVQVAAALLQPGSIAENLRGRDVRLVALLDGPFATPTIAYQASAALIGFGDMAVEGLAASDRATVDADRILIPVSATARRVTGLNAAAGGLLTNLSLNGDLAWANGRILSDNLRLRSQRIDATAIIVADMAQGRYTGALKGRVNDYQVDGLGRVSLTTDASLRTGASGGFGIGGVVRIVTSRIDNATLRDNLGGNAVTTARFDFDENGVATVRDLRLTAPAFRVTDGDGSYNSATGAIDLRATATSTQYGPLALRATGTLERPRAVLRAARPGLGVDLRDLVAELQGTAAGYRVKARAGSAYGPVIADLLIRAGQGPLAIDIDRARFAGVDVRGGIVQTGAGPFAGRLTLAGSGLNGDVRLSAAGANQRADVNLVANAANIPGDAPITIGSGTARGSAVLYPAGPSIKGDFSFADIRRGEFLVAKARGRVDYAAGRGGAALVANGRAGAPFDIAAQAALAPDRIVANARGTANGIAFRLAAPAVVSKVGADWRLQPATLVLPQGRAVLAGRYGGDTQFTARLDEVDIGIVQAFVPGLGLGGKASGRIDYAAPAGAAVPTLDARIDIARFTRSSAYVVSEPVDIATRGTLNADGGDVRFVIRRASAVVGRAQARLAPLGAGATLGERLFAAPLSGGIRYSGPAEVLWTLTGIAGQELSGPIAVAADFGGRLEQPTLTGVMRASALRYENNTFGTVIRNIALNGRFTQSRLELASLTGRAGDGTVSASGTVGLDAASGFPINLNARLDRAQLARSDALGATVSGTLGITSSQAGGGLIEGDLRIPEARYQIILQGAAEVAELEGVRRRTDRPRQQGEAAAASAFANNWRLDVRIRADNQIFVSGMGLEAEWATDLRVRGTATNPEVIGSLDVVRGTYSFAGRRFDLDESGRVVFEGGPLTDPQLNLAATTSVEGVTATINIGGRAQNPQISFTSTPALPQDEVLSRLLFGESVTSLSPTQAIQLAAALNSLRGSGGGLNPLGKLRSATGIDRLRVLGADKTAGRGTALAAGQYISNDIYVEIITDARGFTATQLEIALSRAFSLLSQTGSFGGSSVNLRYSKDY